MIFKIAFRNVFRQKRRSLLTALTMVGGFVLTAISIGWSDGTYSSVINMFTRNRLGHIQIHEKGYLDKPSIYNTIRNYRKIGKDIKKIKGVNSWSPRLFAAGIASLKEKSTGIEIIGIDPKLENRTTRFNNKIIKGGSFSAEPSREVIIGKGLAEILDAEAGKDEIVILSQAADGSIANDLYKVRGIIDSGDPIQNRTAAYVHLKDAQSLFVLEGQIHEIAVIVNHLDQVEEIMQKISQKLKKSSLSVASWKEFAQSFYQAMKADQQGMWIMLFVIMLIVAVGVLNTVLMSVLERTREYGVLKAVGTRPLGVMGKILLEVIFLALASIVIGSVISYVVNSVLSVHGISLPQSFTYGGIEFKTMYSEVNARSFVLSGLTVLLAALFISLIPALRAARIKPAKAMRVQ